MGWTIVGILMVLWILGMIVGVGGQFIHLLLIAAGAVSIFNLIANRRQAF